MEPVLCRKAVQSVQGEKCNITYYIDSDHYIYKRAGNKRSRCGNLKLKCDFENCNVVGDLINDVIELPCTQHNHDAAVSKVVILRFIERIKELAKLDFRSFSTIYDELAARLPEGIVAPDKGTMKSSFYRHRNIVAQPVPKTPIPTSELAANPSYFVRGKPFYRKSVTLNGRTTLIFLSCDVLATRLSTATSIAVDGTFKSSPRLYKQLVSIHFEIMDEMIPAAYFLMQDKSKQSFIAAFKELNRLLPGEFAPLDFMSDFENSLTSAVKEVYKGISLTGSWYHYTQSILKKVSKVGLKAAFVNGGIVEIIIRKIMDIPLLHSSKLHEAIPAIRREIDELDQTDGSAEKLRTVLLYVKRFWLSSRIGAKILSVYGQKRHINNCIEEFNSSLRKKMGLHPEFFIFLERLIDIDNCALRKLLQLESGQNVLTLKTPIQQAQDKRIETLSSALMRKTEPISVGSFLAQLHSFPFQRLDFDDDEDDAISEDYRQENMMRNGLVKLEIESEPFFSFVTDEFAVNRPIKEEYDESYGELNQLSNDDQEKFAQVYVKEGMLAQNFDNSESLCFQSMIQMETSISFDSPGGIAAKIPEDSADEDLSDDGDSDAGEIFTLPYIGHADIECSEEFYKDEFVDAENVVSPANKLFWRSRKASDFPCVTIPFTGQSYISQPVKSPIEYFYHEVDENLLEKIVEESNRFALQNNVNKPLDLDVNELKQFIGIIYKMSIVKMPDRRMYWDKRTRYDKISDVMSCERFQCIKKNFHCNDNKTRPANCTDKLYKIRPLINSFTEKVKSVIPPEHLLVHEQVIPFKEASILQKYNHKKRKKLGYKIFLLLGNDGLVHNFEIFTGEEWCPCPNLPDIQTSGNIVMTLLQNIPRNMGYKLYCGNMFTSIHLQTTLFNQGIACFGVARINELYGCQMPSDADMLKNGVGSSVIKSAFVNNTELRAIKWLNDKGQLFLTTFAGIDPISKIERFDRTEKRQVEIDYPDVVKLYNSSLRDLDEFDALIATYKNPIKSKKWYLRIIFHLFDMMVVQAWLLYKKDADQNGITKAEQILFRNFKYEIATCLTTERKCS